MTGDFENVYEDDERARSYAALEFPGTYALAFRDLPRLIAEHVGAEHPGSGRAGSGRAGAVRPGAEAHALDFGCGTGRSTRFLKELGLVTVGADISEAMLAQARARDPQGDYRLVPEDGLPGIERDAYDLVLSAFTFDNVPTGERKVALFRSLRSVLKPGGRILNLVSSPEIYRHEWASFSTKDFPENHTARSGERVRIVMLDVGDRRPVEDVLWSDEAWRDVYRRCGLEVLAVHRPLATGAEPQPWVSEMTVSPWAIWVLGR